jgi:aspartate kinase
MLKVCKFGGSSLADEKEFAKVKAIVESDPSRQIVVVSAPGNATPGITRLPIFFI